jgi:hypothetical protein
MCRAALAAGAAYAYVPWHRRFPIALDSRLWKDARLMSPTAEEGACAAGNPCWRTFSLTTRIW